MSASPIARHATGCQAIPTRKVLITDPAMMPDTLSSTPGGTLYGTTPGGTKIIYERSFLMTLRESPISQTPPKFTNFPAGMLRGSTSPPRPFRTAPNINKRRNSSRSGSIDENCETFAMDL